MIKFITTALLALACATGFAAVDANKASQAELEAVKGIGPSLATRILDGRKASPYVDWVDFAGRVKGVGPGNAARFSADGLTVAGATYSASPAAAVSTQRKAGSKAEKADAKAMR
jgi:competence protein ComEA